MHRLADHSKVCKRLALEFATILQADALECCRLQLHLSACHVKPTYLGLHGYRWACLLTYNRQTRQAVGRQEYGLACNRYARNRLRNQRSN